MKFLPDRYKWADLDAAELRARVLSSSAIERASAAPTACRVTLYGRSDSGKTSLGIAIARRAAEIRGVNAMYVKAPDLDLARDQAPKGRGEAELVQRAIEVPVLVLDELGSEKHVSTAVVDVIHGRLDTAGRQTITVLVLTPKEVVATYSDGVARRLFTGALRIRCDEGEQVTPRTPVEQVRIVAPWSPPPPRPGMVAVAAELAGVSDPAEYRKRFDAFVERFGGGPVALAPAPVPLRDVDYAESDEAEADNAKTGTGS